MCAYTLTLTLKVCVEAKLAWTQGITTDMHTELTQFFTNFHCIPRVHYGTRCEDSQPLLTSNYLKTPFSKVGVQIKSRDLNSKKLTINN